MKSKSQKGPEIPQLRKDAEEKYVKIQEASKKPFIEIDTSKLLHELEVHKIEFEMQNAELQKAKEKAEQSAIKYAQLYDELYNFMPCGYFKTDSSGIIQELNLNGAAMLGQERSFLIKERFTHFIATESLLVFEKFLNEIFESKKKQICEVTLTTQKNVSIFVRLEGVVSKNEEHCLLTAVDITNRRITEETLKTNFTLLSIAGKTAKFGGWSIKLSENRVIWSDEVAAIHEMPAGYSPTITEAIGFYAPEWIEKITKVYTDCAKKGIPYDEILQIITAKGKRVWVRATGQAISDENGRIVSVQGSFQDITDRKQTEESLQSSKAYAENLIQTANAIVIGMDIKGNVLTFNKAAEKITGYSIDELRGHSWFEVIVPKNRFPEVWEIFAKLTNGSLPKYFENPILTKTGEERYIIWHNNEVKEHGKIIGSISFGIDITGRRQVEEALRISENKYRRLHESIMDGFIQTTLDGRIIDWNPSLVNMLGYNHEELSKLNYRNLTPEKWHEFESKIVEDQILAQGYSQVYEKEYIRKDGAILPVELRAFLIKNDDNESQGMWALVRDITHRKLNMEIDKSRLHLNQFSLSHTVNEFMEEMLNEAEKLTGSQISFMHFVKEDQKYLVHQNWSKRTKAEFCTAQEREAHYPLSEAGVWVDCVYARKPVIHNDYASLPHRKGMPEGHAKVIRELVVPVFRGEKITAILGVGNKLIDYTQDDADALTAIANLGWEIAERMKAEEALRDSEEHFRTIFNTSPIGMVLVNKHFNFMQTNQSFSNFTGYPVEELLNLTFKDITHPDFISGDIDALNKLLSGKLNVYQTEKIYIRKDHQQVWGNVNVTPIFDKKGNFLHFLAMIKDITDRKIADAEIQRINEELKEANAAKDKFFSIIAHDLKSPFNSILGFSEMLKDDVKNLRMDEIQHFAKLIHSSAYHTYLLLENLLEWSRMQRGQISFSPKSIILDQLVNDEFEVIKNNASQKSITILNSIPRNLIVSADENMLSNIIRNLVSNAIKFTPREGFVKVSAEVSDGYIHISVADNGIGIKPEAIGKLFKIETSFTTRGTENEKGTGLGLLLCKEFIEKHRGKIRVESEPGKGSKFIFMLPVI